MMLDHVSLLEVNQAITSLVVTLKSEVGYCLSGSLILHSKLPGKRCGHFLSSGSDLSRPLREIK